MLFQDRFRALSPAKYRAHRENGTIHLLVQIIHSHTIEFYQKPTETLPQLINKYLSAVNVDKRKQASKLLREIISQTSNGDKTEIEVFDSLEAFRQSVENFAREYSSGRPTLASKEYEKFITHFRILFCQLRFRFFIPAIDLDIFELFGGVYLLLDILLLDYHLNVKSSGNVTKFWNSEILATIRKHTVYLLYETLTKFPKYGSTLQKLFSMNRQLISILLQILDGQQEKHLTNIYVNQRIIQILAIVLKEDSGIHVNLLNLSRLRDCGAVRILKNFCQTVPDEQAFSHALEILTVLTREDNREFFQHFDSSKDLLFNCLKISFDLRPENNKVRIFFRRFCERILPRIIFCPARKAYHLTTFIFWAIPAGIFWRVNTSFVFFGQNSDSGWRSRLIKLMLKRFNYFYSFGCERNLLIALKLLVCILPNVHEHPTALDRLRQEDICSKLVDILTIERTDLMLESCFAMMYLTSKSIEASEPERHRLRELRVGAKLECLIKYSSRKEKINEVAQKVLNNLSIDIVDNNQV